LHLHNAFVGFDCQRTTGFEIAISASAALKNFVKKIRWLTVEGATNWIKKKGCYSLSILVSETKQT